MLDLRVIRVGVEVSGEMHYYESLEEMHIIVTGAKSANATQNKCKVILSGLNRETRDFLLTATSPFNADKQPKRLTVEAGRVSTGLYRLFLGDIVSAEPSSPPDVDLTLKANTGNAADGKVVSRAQGGRAQLSTISQSVADDIGAQLDFQATDKLINNYTYTGGALGQINRLAEAGGVRAFLDDDVLLVQDQGATAKGRIKILNMESGMVGVPKVTEKGVKVTYLFDGQSALGGLLRVESRYNEPANGDYVIDQLGFELTTHEDQFFYTATCSVL